MPNFTTKSFNETDTDEPLVVLVNALIAFFSKQETSFASTSGRVYTPNEVFASLFNVAAQKLVVDAAIDHISNPKSDSAEPPRTYEELLRDRAEVLVAMLTRVLDLSITKELTNTPVLHAARLHVSTVGGNA